MTQPDHLADEVFSELVDDQLTPDEVSIAQAHLETCLACQTRLEQMRALVGLLQALPSIEPPRDFQIGPRLVVDPPNVVRLRRWYAFARVGAGTLAATFVFLSVGTLYVDSRPVVTPSALSSKAQPAPETTSADAAPTLVPPAPAPAARVAAAAPAAASSGQAPSSPPPAPALARPAPAAAGAAAQSQAVPTPTSTEPGDQVAAATSVRQLPTQVPTPTLVARAPSAFASSPVSSQQNDPAAPLRIAAALVGVLAALGIFIALLIRHRLQAASPSHLE